LLIFIFFNSNIKDKIINNKILNNKILNKFYKGSEIEKFIIENFQSDYDIKPYVPEEENKKIKNENKLKEINIEKQIEKQEEINNIKYNQTENYENNEEKKDVIEPFKLSVEEIKKLYENIKLEINKLD
jgi:hypothetical protein